MASAYPGALDTFATNKADATTTPTDHPTHHNDLADAVNKIEAELGVTPSGAAATVAARLAGIGVPLDRTLVLPPTSGWSWVNQGTSTITDVGDGRVVLGAPSAGGNNLVARVRTAPATPYTLIARVDGACITLGGNDGWGVCFRESSTSEITMFYRQPTDATPACVENWTNPTTFSASLANTAYLAATPTWFRLTDDGTNLTFALSYDGFSASFIQIHTMGRTTFMAGGPDQIGFITRNDSGARVVSLQSWDVS